MASGPQGDITAMCLLVEIYWHRGRENDRSRKEVFTEMILRETDCQTETERDLRAKF